MALPTSGTLTMAQINAEFGRGNNLNAYRGTVWYTDAGASGTFSSGAISMSDFYGKRATSPLFTATIYNHYDQLNLRSWALSAGWNGSSAAMITLAGGYYLYSSNVGAAALYIDGSWPGGLTFVNNGYIMGCGGHGGGTRSNLTTEYASNVELQNGGPAISMGVSCTIQNNSYIGGGGGGGGGAFFQNGTYIYGQTSICGGGGAGGGQGGSTYTGVAPGTLSFAGGGGGGIGGGGANGVTNTLGAYTGNATGGGGGRIMPGARTGSPNAVANSGNAFGGYGGEGGVAGANQYIASAASGGTASTGVLIGGYGGQAGGSGAAISYTGSYNAQTAAGGGGGGWGASGGQARAISTGTYAGEAYAGGAAGGYCVYLNGNSITWSATGTRWGAIG